MISAKPLLSWLPPPSSVLARKATNRSKGHCLTRRAAAARASRSRPPGLCQSDLFALLLHLLHKVHPETGRQADQELHNQLAAEELWVSPGGRACFVRRSVDVAEVVPAIEDLLRRRQARVPLHELQQPAERV
eukprot:CAMPEP_0115323540 /NCGR_PEP_ID=MMETSP0270-20121206/81997_1 /TAXON_ID=71861 /ORGANISM="Scrippsiella trochoidea, Strain CCMP3099" /LENGTH=132 /DNA_ID=CAMNT_0002743593 /DNA_START=141 /DNA_END=537 /DNA_ORIENTATION=+